MRLVVMAATGVDEFTHTKYNLKGECKTEPRASSVLREMAQRIGGKGEIMTWLLHEKGSDQHCQGQQN